MTSSGANVAFSPIAAASASPFWRSMSPITSRAPSAANRQPWQFVVVADAALKQGLRRAFVGEAADRGEKYRSVTEKQADLLLAPALVLVCGDAGSKPRYVNADEIGDAVQEELFLLSMGAAIQTLLLAATAAGLTSTWLARPARLPAA